MAVEQSTDIEARSSDIAEDIVTEEPIELPADIYNETPDKKIDK